MQHVKEESTYEATAREFLESTGTTFEAKFLFHGKHFDDDKDTRDVYQITLTRNGREWRFNFGQSINDSGTSKTEWVNLCPKTCEYWDRTYLPCPKKAHVRKRTAPTPYSALACITKSDPGTFKNFCADYGYDDDSIKAQKTYFAVQEEWDGANKLFSDVMDKLAEIQ